MDQDIDDPEIDDIDPNAPLQDEPAVEEKVPKTVEEQLAEERLERAREKGENEALRRIVTELREGGNRREDAPPPQHQMTKEEREEANASLALRMQTEPLEVLAIVESRAEQRAYDRIKRETGAYDETTADAVIEKFVRKAKKENPVVGDKVADIFNEEIDKLGTRAKTQLLSTPPEERERLLNVQWEAAAGKYLLPRARPKIRGQSGTDPGGGGGRTAGELPGRRANRDGFRYTETQKAAMRRQGLSDERITKSEENIRKGNIK
jgi:hypothetical protein